LQWINGSWLRGLGPFALRVIALTEALPRRRVADVIGRPLLQSGTSVGADYRTACRARSASELVAKVSFVEEDLDECLYWIELLDEAGQVAAARVAVLQAEAHQLLSIAVDSMKTEREAR
jgi:four helix bundle protein